MKTKVVVGEGEQFTEEKEIVTKIINSVKKIKRECVKHAADDIYY